MLRVDEVIARKEVTVVFDDGNVTAGLPKNTQRMLLSEGCSGGLLEYLYLDLSDIHTLPLVEDGAQKSAESFRRHRALADTPLGVGLRLNQG